MGSGPQTDQGEGLFPKIKVVWTVSKKQVIKPAERSFRGWRLKLSGCLMSYGEWATFRNTETFDDLLPLARLKTKKYPRINYSEFRGAQCARSPRSAFSYTNTPSPNQPRRGRHCDGENPVRVTRNKPSPGARGAMKGSGDQQQEVCTFIPE